MTTVIIGAGPAGLMAAGAVKSGTVVVLEKNEKPGKKLYITGKGRCNVTNDCDLNKMFDSVVTNPRFLFGAFSRFSPRDTMRFLEEAGIPLKTERGGRVFPASDKASDITAALVKYAAANGAKIRLTRAVSEIFYAGAARKFSLKLADGETLVCENLILATGGKSYPLTGSTGDGYRFARALGHTVLPPRPALVPIKLSENVKELEGLSLKNAAVSAKSNGKTYRDFGELLFTADGVSGPCALSLSSYLSRDGLDADSFFSIDLKPALSAEQLDARILRDFAAAKNKRLKNALFDLLPKSLVPFIIRYAELDGETAVNSLTKSERGKLAKALKSLTFRIDALGSVERGIVTGGGVDVREVNPKTMESKLIPSLYFAGELLDVDALTGGFNIQIALSTGRLAGESVGNNE